MGTSKVQTGLRLEESVLQKITYIAKKQRRSLNAEIELAVDRAIEDFEKDNGVIPLGED